MVNQIFVMAGCYAGVMLLTIVLISAIFRGFFWSYIKVRTSFGKLVMVKCRNTLRDYFTVAKVEENFLVFKYNKLPKRLALVPNIFYRCLMVNWVDYDETKDALTKADYSTVSGFDSVKFSDLLTRALMRPTVKTQFETIVIALLVGALLVGLASVYVSYLSYQDTQKLIPLIANMKGTIVSSTGL